MEGYCASGEPLKGNGRASWWHTLTRCQRFTCAFVTGDPSGSCGVFCTMGGTLPDVEPAVSVDDIRGRGVAIGGGAPVGLYFRMVSSAQYIAGPLRVWSRSARRTWTSASSYWPIIVRDSPSAARASTNVESISRTLRN